MITPSARKALLSKQTSRQNKLWLAVTWKHFAGWYLEWKWQGEPMQSRLTFQFELDGPWLIAMSYDEDVVPTLKFGKEKQKV